MEIQEIGEQLKQAIEDAGIACELHVNKYPTEPGFSQTLVLNKDELGRFSPSLLKTYREHAVSTALAYPLKPGQKVHIIALEKTFIESAGAK